METQISQQVWQLVCSLLTGAGLGLVYDILRVFRRRLKTNAVFDLLFWLIALFALFTLGMDAGEGALHIHMLLFTACGFAAYILLFSTFMLKALNKAADCVETVLKPLKILDIFLILFAKNLFKSTRDWFIMVKSSLKRGKSHEESPFDNGDSSGITDRVCYPEPDKSKVRHSGCDSNVVGTEKRNKHSRGKQPTAEADDSGKRVG